jgi:outer membrane protein assembly factor BamD
MKLVFEQGSASHLARRAAPKLVRALVLLWAAGALAGCSVFEEFNPFGAEKYKMVIEPDIPASKVYDQGLAKLANGAPQEAAKKFTDLGKQYPGSDWARKGLIMTTYAQYQAGDYESAEQSAQRYVKEYPKTPEAAYALYLEASSYYSQIPDISRDQDRSAKALDAFKKVATIRRRATPRKRSTA